MGGPRASAASSSTPPSAADDVDDSRDSRRLSDSRRIELIGLAYTDVAHEPINKRRVDASTCSTHPSIDGTGECDDDADAAASAVACSCAASYASPFVVRSDPRRAICVAIGRSIVIDIATFAGIDPPISSDDGITGMTSMRTRGRLRAFGVGVGDTVAPTRLNDATSMSTIIDASTHAPPPSSRGLAPTCAIIGVVAALIGVGATIGNIASNSYGNSGQYAGGGRINADCCRARLAAAAAAFIVSLLNAAVDAAAAAAATCAAAALDDAPDDDDLRPDVARRRSTSAASSSSFARAAMSVLKRETLP